MVEAVRAELEELAGRDANLASGALAHLALAMAREIDSERNSATSKSMCASRLLEALEQLRVLAPEPKEEEDELERRRRERAERLARQAAAGSAASPAGD